MKSRRFKNSSGPCPCSKFLRDGWNVSTDGRGRCHRSASISAPRHSAKQKPGLLTPALAIGTQGTSPADSEAELKEDLALPWRNALAWLAHKDVVVIDRNRSGIHKSKARPIINIVVRPTNSHTVEDIGVFHPQFTSQMFAKIEMFGQRHSFVTVEWVA